MGDVTFQESIFPFQSIPSSTFTSPSDPLSQICTPNAPPLLVHDPIQHYRFVPLVDGPSSDHVDDLASQILEDHFSDLPKELIVFLGNDMVDDPVLHPKPLPPPSALIPLTTSLPRRSTRVTKPPPYLQSYKCNSISTRYPIANYVSHNQLSPSYSHFYNSIYVLKEPQFYHKAVGDPKWEAAMAAEIQALE